MSKIEWDKRDQRVEIENDSSNEFYAALGTTIVGLGILVGGWLYSKKLESRRPEDSYEISEIVHEEKTGEKKKGTETIDTTALGVLMMLGIGAVLLIPL